MKSPTEQQLLNRLKWALYRIEAEAYEMEDNGGYASGMRDARKLIESAFFKELDGEGYYDN